MLTYIFSFQQCVSTIGGVPSMAHTGPYQFSPEKRSALEALPHALAAYQYVDGSVRTLLVSDGMCRFARRSREELTNRLDQNMFSSVHPDDIELLANLGYEFITKECAYDVVYRTRLSGDADYRLVHVIGKFQCMEDGARVAMLTYADITDTPHHQMQALAGTVSPKTRFFDENLGAMAIVSRRDKRLLYYNQALTRLLPPQTTFDSGITFNRFFFDSDSNGMPELFEAIDTGSRLTTNPLTQRKIETNTLSTHFGGEPAYVVYFYEERADSSKEALETEMRHRRDSFHAAIFSGESNGLSFHDGAYKGFRVWNLTRNVIFYQAASAELFPTTDTTATLEQYTDAISPLCCDPKQRDRIQEITCERLSMLYESGTYPREFTLSLGTSRGVEQLNFRITMMRSPDIGDLYLKIEESNVTESTVIDMLVAKTIEQVYDYVAYSDLNANRCHIVSGTASASGKRSYCIKTSDFIHSPSDIRTFSTLFPPHIKSLEQMHAHLVSLCDTRGCFTTLQELPGGVIKSIYLELVDPARKTFFIRCKDVTSLLRAEREQQEALSQAVLAERARAERLQLQTVLSISNALDARDPLTCSHSQRVAQYSTALAKRIGWPQDRVENLYRMALVHDIGKIGVPDAVLQKCGMLTQDEYKQIQAHVDIGGFILKDFSAIDKVAEGALYHHERYDGKGYSRGLSGEHIPIEARIICIADALDAMNSTRPYRNRQSEAYIRGELLRERGKQFDPQLVDALLTMIDEGSLKLPEDALPAT